MWGKSAPTLAILQTLPGGLDSHDLIELHGLAEPKAIIAPYFLGGLTYMSEWRARYPTPKTAYKYWPMDAEGTMQLMGGLWPGNYDDIFRYSSELDAELSALISVAA